MLYIYRLITNILSIKYLTYYESDKLIPKINNDFLKKLFKNLSKMEEKLFHSFLLDIIDGAF